MNLLALAAAAPTAVLEKGAEQIFDGLAQTLLGLTALLGIIIAVVAVVMALRAQDKANTRIDKANARLEKQNEKVTGLVAKMTETFAGVDRAITSLTAAEKDSQGMMQQHMNLLSQMKQSQDTIIRDAVLGRGSTVGGE